MSSATTARLSRFMYTEAMAALFARSSSSLVTPWAVACRAGHQNVTEDCAAPASSRVQHAAYKCKTPARREHASSMCRCLDA